MHEVHLKTKEVRELLVTEIPEKVICLDDDDHIRAAIAGALMVMMMTEEESTRMDGESRTNPPILGPLRNIDVRIVRNGDNISDYVVEHSECQKCLDVVATTKQAALDHLLGSPVAIVQYTYDRIDGVVHLTEGSES